MLIEFRLKNFKSFRDEQVLSLVASADHSLPQNVVELPGDKKLRVLKSAVLYGANASGKTNLLDALIFVRHFVRSSATKEPSEKIEVSPFLLESETSHSPSLFELTFLQEGTIYQYGFAVDETKVHQEWLTSYPKGRPRKLFSRSINEDGSESYEFGPHLRGEKEKLREFTRPNALFLSVSARFNNPQLTVVYGWFSKQLKSLDAHEDSGNLGIPCRIVEERPALLADLKRMLVRADLGIVDVDIEVNPLQLDTLPDQVPDEFRAFLTALAADAASSVKQISVGVFHQGTEGRIRFDMETESNGTRQFFCLSAVTLSVIADGAVLIVDELDASMHPLLVRWLVQLFHDPESNPQNAQLIFNTHDTTLLSASLFRRDQIWLVEKNRDGASVAYSLLEYRPRKDEALEKGYLQGRYGAIPFLGSPAHSVIDSGEA